MTIKHCKPPGYRLIRLFFPAASYDSTIFTVAPHIYCKVNLSPDLIQHETVHLLQQKSRFGALIWWIRFILSKKYRLNAELEAYRIQYKWAKQHYDRNATALILRNSAKDLGGALYGGLMTYDEAVKAIQHND